MTTGRAGHWQHLPAHRRWSAGLMAVLFVTSCTAPRTAGRHANQGSSHAPRAEPLVDEGLVRLERLPDERWRLVVVRPPFAASSRDFTRSEVRALASALSGYAEQPSPHGATIEHAGLFAEDTPPAPPPDWARRLWNDYSAKYGSRFLPPVEEVATSRLRLALQLSLPFMPAGLADAAREMLSDPLLYAGLLAGLAFYIGAWLLPEPIFSKGTAILLTWALLLVFTVSEIRHAATALWRLYQESGNAQSLAELEVAAERFGRAASASLLRVLALIASRYTARALPSVPAGGYRSLRFEPLATPDGALLGGRIVVSTATVVADGTLVLAGAALGIAGGGGPASPCAKEKRPADQMHHIATDANNRSTLRGGQWTPRFARLFARADMSLDDPANLVNLRGHYGPHPEAYHAEVYRRLTEALDDCATPGTCRPLMLAALRDLAADICTPGSLLNQLITKG